MRYTKFKVWADGKIKANIQDYEQAELYAHRLHQSGNYVATGVINRKANEFVLFL